MTRTIQQEQPCTIQTGLGGARVEPCTLVIFGGSGDLTRRKLLPALYNLALDGLLPPNYAVIGIGRKPWSDDEFRKIAHDSIEQFSRQSLRQNTWTDFIRRLHYVSGASEDLTMYQRLHRRIEEIETQFNLPGHRIFYLAIPPTSFALSCQGLRHVGLIYPVESSDRVSRVIVEKPIGHDLESARAINTTIGEVFDESQIYRIDHYLGKETVQNIMVLRFANSIFEPIWNHKYIDHVQITVSEEEGLGTRGSYYEEAGALRDMMQNHILQLLCLIAMEPPYSLETNVVRNAQHGGAPFSRPSYPWQRYRECHGSCAIRPWNNQRPGSSRIPTRGGRPIRFDNGDVCGPTVLRRKLAVVRSTLLSANGESHAASGYRNCGSIQRYSGNSFQRRLPRAPGTQRAYASHSTTRGNGVENHV